MPSGKVMLIIIALILIGWVLWSWLVVRGLEKPEYSVIEERDGYEIRQYQSYLVAETVVEETNEGMALNQGFVVIADYIFGNNTKQEKIAMTAPVASTETSEKIAMTAPVISTEASTSSRTVSFMMPSKYTLETLPQPNDERVMLREVEPRLMAVRKFSWWATDEKISVQKGKLRASLTQDNIEIIGDMEYAGYNPPLSAPFMRRHEVAVPITQETLTE